MTNNTHKYKIGIVDEEESWIEVFKRKLKTEFDIYIFPLDGDTEPADILYQIEQEKIQCVLADYELNETAVVKFNGDQLVDIIKDKYPYFPIFIITGQSEDYVISQVEDNDIVRDKAEINDKTDILIHRVNNKINTYYSHIEDAEKQITNLIEKKNNQGITISEEEILTKNYLFLEKINPSDKEIPENLIQPSSITQLNEFAVNTKNILEELRKMNK